MALETVHSVPHRGLRDHKVLIAFALIAVVYCLGAPVLGNFLAQLGP